MIDGLISRRMALQAAAAGMSGACLGGCAPGNPAPDAGAFQEVPLTVPAPSIESQCRLDPPRLWVFEECRRNYQMDSHAPGSEWPWNVISKNAVAWSCGYICRDDEPVSHTHDIEEFQLCYRLATEATGIMHGCAVGMGSESTDPFRPYHVVIPVGDPVPEAITGEVIRDAFGGTIYPPTEIVIEPLEERGEWWRQVVVDGSGDENYLRPWRDMVQWFQSQEELYSPVFVMVGDDPLDPDFRNGGSVFPRIAVALTAAGSLVGIGGWTVHT